MELTRRDMLRLTAAGALAAHYPSPARAAEFPTKPVTLICPWPAGGSTDQQMRALAEVAGKHLGQPVVIENKPGGSGTVGAATMAATAKPDGYTIAQIPITIFRLPHMQKVTWDPLKDFTYIIHLTGYTFGVVVKADSPWKFWHRLPSAPNPVASTDPFYSRVGVKSLHITMEAL